MALPLQNIPAYYVYGTVRNLLAGAGLCYAVQSKRYAEIPFTLVVPSVYAGYHLYKNKEAVIQWMKDMSRPHQVIKKVKDEDAYS